MSNLHDLHVTIVMVGAVGLLCAFIFFVYATYLAHKYLPSVEMTMTGHNIHTVNWFFSIHAVILFGSVFAWDWHARRQKHALDDRDWFEARENVPLNVRRKFIAAFVLMLLSCILGLGSAGILQLLGK